MVCSKKPLQLIFHFKFKIDKPYSLFKYSSGMLCLPKRRPGSPSASASEDDEAEGNDEVLKSDTSKIVDEHSLVDFFSFVMTVNF